MQQSFLEDDYQTSITTDEYDASLGQWMTPSWVAEAIIDDTMKRFRDPTVIEPTCGIGRFLNALPVGTRAIGVEIDSSLAERARRGSPYEVITGDFRTVDLPVDRADLVIGNPPFDMKVLDGVITRCETLLDQGGEIVMILPAFTFQTSSRVTRYNLKWSIEQKMMPRNIFSGIRLPLVLARFIRDDQPQLIGFLFYHQSREIEEMPKIYRRALEEGRSGWHAVVQAALQNLGGEASITEICAEIEPRRPTATEHWKPKIRQQLSRNFKRTAPGRYRMAA